MSGFELPHPGGKLMSTQVSSLLLSELKSGSFMASDRLPSEVELAEKLGVSRTVIRDALSDIEREGLIERVRGIGTVINRDIVNLSSRLDLKVEYNELIRGEGYTPKTDSLSLRSQPADDELCDILKLDAGEPVIVCKKRILAGERPVIYSIDFLPASLFGDTDYSRINWELPIFDILEHYCGLSIVTDIARVSATNAEPSIRAQLALSDGDALMMLDEVGYCKFSRPVMRSFEFYTDFFDFKVLRKKF